MQTSTAVHDLALIVKLFYQVVDLVIMKIANQLHQFGIIWKYIYLFFIEHHT